MRLIQFPYFQQGYHYNNQDLVCNAFFGQNRNDFGDNLCYISSFNSGYNASFSKFPIRLRLL